MYIKNLISVIIPIYNCAGYLEECVASICSQSYRELEVILVDDGSGDDSGTICDKLAKKDDRIIVLHKANGGVSDARNCGLKKAKGEYVAFVDSDDTAPANYFEQSVRAMQMYELDIVIGAMRYNYPDRYVDRGIILSDNENIKIYDADINYLIYNLMTGGSDARGNELSKCVHSGPCARLYRYDLIYNIRFEKNLFIAEDLVFNFEAFIKSKKVGISKYVWYNYRCHSASVTKNANREAVRNFRHIVKCATKFNLETGNKYKAEWDIQVIAQFSYALQQGIVASQLGYSFLQKYRRLKEVVNDSNLREYFIEIEYEKLPLKKKVLYTIFRYKLIVAGIIAARIFMLLSKNAT